MTDEKIIINVLNACVEQKRKNDKLAMQNQVFKMLLNKQFELLCDYAHCFVVNNEKCPADIDYKKLFEQIKAFGKENFSTELKQKVDTLLAEIGGQND